MPRVRRQGARVRLALLLVALAGCGSIAVEPGADASRPELAAREAGALEAAPERLEAHDAGADVDACPPTALTCTGLPGACPQGQTMGRRSICGGPAVGVCCPVNDCELVLCDVCPLCVP
jgi:hypothetical protein